MRKNIFTLFVFFVLIYLSALGQNKNLKAHKIKTDKECFKIIFYNSENFFDAFDDPKTEDDEFIPNSKKHWKTKRYFNKINNFYKVFVSFGIQPPSIIGLCEIENDHVLNDLVFNTPLLKFDYHYIHHDSPDPRGIDVALLYRPDQFKPLDTQFIKIVFPFDTARKTREIMYVKGIALHTDTLHVFINHWPSRSKGQVESIPYREFAAKILRRKIDSLFLKNTNSNVVIIGDFNDEPDDSSITKVLNATNVMKPLLNSYLYNLSFAWLENVQNIGTIKFKGKWQIFDQIIVSGNMLNSSARGLKCDQGSAKIYSADFLLTDDSKFTGKTTFRTYNGYRYTGGFSDHLPVYVDLCLRR
jgi:hypothetical protein